MKPELSLFYVPVPDAGVGESIARDLLERKLIVCANIFAGGRSFYRWEGEVVDASECLLLLKTGADRVDAVRAELEDLHPYSCPCILDWPVGASDAFREWVQDEVGGGK